MGRIYSEGPKYPTDLELHSQAPAQFGQYSPVIKVLRIDLSTARDDEKFSIGGSILWAYDATDSISECSIRFNTQQSDKVKFTLGQSLSIRFHEIWVTNTAQSGKYIEFLYTTEGQELRGLNPVGAESAVTVSKASTIVTYADVTLIDAAAAVVIRAANTDGRVVEVCALASNTGPVRIGDSNIGDARGIELNPGECFTFGNVTAGFTGAIYGYAPTGGGNQTVSVTEIDD